MLERHRGEVQEVAKLIEDISTKLPSTRDWALLKSAISSMTQSYARGAVQRTGAGSTGSNNAAGVAAWDWQASVLQDV
jgi:hypothetical protein